MPNRKIVQLLQVGLLVVVITTVAACSSSLAMKVESDVPTPLVDQQPLVVGVYYDDAFRNHVYSENTEDRPNWSIQTGASQVAMFDRILPAVFRETREVSGTSANGVDAILAPELAEMQFSLPRETRLEVYEAWVKYNIRLHDPSGASIAEWVITGYGKSPSEFMTNTEKAVNAAVNLALRDAGAKLSLGFDQVPEVNEWLKTR